MADLVESNKLQVALRLTSRCVPVFGTLSCVQSSLAQPNEYQFGTEKFSEVFA